MTSDLLPPGLDIVQATRDFLVVIVFPATRASGYQQALAHAQAAASYAEAVLDGRRLHFAAFGRNHTDAARALSVLRAIRTVRGLQIYGGGKLLQDWGTAEAVLACYLKAQAARDWRAHCHVVTRHPFREDLAGVDLSVMIDPFVEPPPEYLMPCALLHRWQVRIQQHHPATPADQYQAAAVEYGCDWCPSFHPEIFREL